VDVSHGYAAADGKILHDHMAMLEALLPYTVELHLKNTDPRYCSTFGFTAEDRRRGIVDLRAVASLLRQHASDLPVRELVGYLEIGGPKLGRDYSDHLLEQELRESLEYCKAVFEEPAGGELARHSSPSEIAERRVLIAPSLMCADALNLRHAIEELEDVGADLLHIDIMDGAFTPNMPVGLGMVEAVGRAARVPVDVHLMVMDHDFFLERLKTLRGAWVSVHVESARHLDRTLSRIRELGMKAGAALNPATPIRAIEQVLDKLDFVLIMTVNPGFAGQALVPATMRKIAECRRYLRHVKRDIPIQVDGNVSFENIPAMVANGADVLVCGSSSLFAPGSLRENARRLHEAIREGLAMREAGQ